MVNILVKYRWGLNQDNGDEERREWGCAKIKAPLTPEFVFPHSFFGVRAAVHGDGTCYLSILSLV